MKLILDRVIKCIVVVGFVVSHRVYATNGITYSFSGGRFGDNLIAYIEARWLSYQTGLEFYYRPFKYSDMLTLHTMHKNYREHDKLRIVSIEDVKNFVQKTDTLYVIDPFPLNNPVNWDDPIFYRMMKEEISPVAPLPKLEIPEGYLNVGIHVRRGGGWDTQLHQSGTLVSASRPSETFDDLEFPTRFAPDSYYIEQLKYLLERFSERNLYVHIFTDDPRPDLIAEKYMRELSHARITFGYRNEGNRHDANVLEDFFMMGQCDVLIRADSNFSYMAARLGRVNLEIRPNDCAWENDNLWITQLVVIEHDRDQEWGSKWYNLPSGPPRKSTFVNCP